MSEPCVFIGSSSEGLEVARKVRNQLDDVAEVTIWHEGPFGLSQGSLESLVAAAHRFDFAILVLTGDDLRRLHHRSGHPPDRRYVRRPPDVTHASPRQSGIPVCA